MSRTMPIKLKEILSPKSEISSPKKSSEFQISLHKLTSEQTELPQEFIKELPQELGQELIYKLHYSQIDNVDEAQITPQPVTTKKLKRTSSMDLERKSDTCKRILGIALTLFGALLASIISLLTKLLYEYKYSGFEQLFYRGFFVGIISFISCYHSKVSIFHLIHQEIKFLKFRTFVWLCYGIVMTICIGFMAASIVLLLLNTASIYTPIISKVFLQEKFNILNILGIFSCFLGIIFIIQPAFIFGETGTNTIENVSLLTFYLGILSLVLVAILISGSLVYTRVIMASINFSICNLIYAVCLMLISAFGVFVPNSRPIHFEYVGVLLIALISVLIFLWDTVVYIAAKYEKPSICAIVMYAQVLITYIAEILFFGLKLGVYDLVGGVLIALTTITISVYKFIGEQDDATLG